MNVGEARTPQAAAEPGLDRHGIAFMLAAGPGPDDAVGGGETEPGGVDDGRLGLLEDGAQADAVTGPGGAQGFHLGEQLKRVETRRNPAIHAVGEREGDVCITASRLVRSACWRATCAAPRATPATMTKQRMLVPSPIWNRTFIRSSSPQRLARKRLNSDLCEGDGISEEPMSRLDNFPSRRQRHEDAPNPFPPRRKVPLTARTFRTGPGQI